MYRTIGLTAGFSFILAAGSSVAARADDAKDAPKPPPGWKEYSPKDGTFAVWIPEKPKSQSTRERTATVKGQRMRINVLALEMAGGPSYLVEELIVPASSKLKADELADSFKDFLTSETGGKVTDEADIQVGKASGKEFRIEATKGISRARVFATNTRVLVMRVTGKKEAVDGEAAKVFLESARFTAGNVAGGAGKTPTILGGAFDPEFKDVAPDGGLLVGFEIGTAKAFNRDMVRSARPIYRKDDQETMGEQRGSELGNVVTLKAKPGFAVGAISVKHGLGFDGMSVTFMKVMGDKLDPKDSYESDYVGTDENKKPTKLGGNGTPVVGIVGKTNSKDMTGMGLLFKGQEGYEPKKK